MERESVKLNSSRYYQFCSTILQRYVMNIVMIGYISLLRGINVSGQKKIRMEELKKLYESLDFTQVKTYIQSGNVIFESPDSDTSELVNRIETKIKQIFGFSVRVIIRTKNEFQHIINNNPFCGIRQEEITKLHVTFLSDTPAASTLNAIGEFENESDEWIIAGKDIYLFCPNGYGRTKLTNNFFEKKLNLSATTRNWNTVNKLHEIVKENENHRNPSPKSC